MNEYYVRVHDEVEGAGSDAFREYNVFAVDRDTAMLIAFILDGGHTDAEVDPGVYELAKLYCEIL